MEKPEITPWTLNGALRTEDEILAFLEIAFEVGDVRLIADGLGLLAKKRGMSTLARQTGLGRESLYKALSRQGNPEFSTLMKVMAALGIRLHFTTEKTASA
jgi:probable addiction module antidote protein